MKTIHLDDNIEIKRKKPKLKFDILECLAEIGKLSKSELKRKLKGRYYPDISHSVDELNYGGFIKIASKTQGRGKEQVFYTITEKGLKVLLADDDLSALRFWKILYGYCQNSDSLVTLDEIEEFYQILIRRYLKYSNHGFSSHLDIFHDMCNNWFQETIFKKSDKITTAQKIIEVLAINPKITFEKLLEKTAESEFDVRQVLSTYLSSTTTSYNPLDGLDENYNERRYTDFLLHNLVTIIQNDDDGKMAYQLSLFGVMLSLALIRYNDMDRLKNGLYFEEDFSFQQYYDKIASNYKEKLPLIFGKWIKLKRTLKVFSAYNFDIVLNKESGSSNVNFLSVVMGENKELLEGIRTIILYNAKLMLEFSFAGWEVLKDYISIRFVPQSISNTENRPDLQRTYPLCAKFEEVMMLLHLTSFIYPSVSMINFKTRHISSILQEMEESFADEITAFYYMNLYNDSRIRINDLPGKYYHSLPINESFKKLEHTPKECLSMILQEDKEEPLIRKWFSKWKKDLVGLQEEILQNIKSVIHI
jgi:hypothetical protein